MRHSYEEPARIEWIRQASADFLVGAIIAAVYSGLPAREAMFCNYCGESNPDDAVFCSKCGKRTAHEHAAAPVAAETHHSAAEAIPDVPAAPGSSTRNEMAHAGAHAAAEPQRVAAAKGTGGRVLWAVGGLVLLVAIISAVAITKSRSGSPPSDGASSGSASGSSSSPGGASTPDSPAPPGGPGSAQGGGAPDSATPAGGGTVVGSWKTPVPLMPDTNLELTADGHYHLKSALAEESGSYVFMDGNLQLTPDGLFDHSTIAWQCQLSGNSMSIIEPDGAAHIYTRVN
jgi:hypothetical protein